MPHRADRRSIFFVVGVLLLGLSTGVAVGDEFVFKNSKISGVLVREENGEVVINTYNSKNQRMTAGIERRPKAELKATNVDADPYRSYLRRLRDLETTGPRDAAAEFELGKFAAEKKWADVAEEHWKRALLIDSVHAGALSRLEKSRLEVIKKTDPRFNAELRSRLERFLTLEKADERKASIDAMKSDFGYVAAPIELERARRSAKEPKGLRRDVPLTLRSKVDHGVYTIFVPEAYDPLVPWPLVVGLHGGGPDGKDGKGVVGSGPSAMNFYAQGAGRHGYIVVCPTAIEASWSKPVNDTFLLSVVEEIELLFNIDLNRVYLTGHSMGGFGTFHFGPKYAHLWAAISPMSGGGRGGFEKLIETKTGIYIYHGADDPVVGPGMSRQAADFFRAQAHDFIYTEIPDSGHGFPQDVNEEMWEFFAVHRLAVAPGRAEKGKFTPALLALSSFTKKVSEDEKVAFGAPGEALPTDRKALVARLRLGGGAAVQAADRLIKEKDPSAAAEVLAVIGDAAASPDARAAALRVFAAVAGADLAPKLDKALTEPPTRVLHEAARTIAALGDKAYLKLLLRLARAAEADFLGRVQKKNDMDCTDFMTAAAGISECAKAIAKLADPQATPALSTIAQNVVGCEWSVPKPERAGLDPEPSLVAMVTDLLAALEAVKDPKGLPAVAAIEKRHGSRADCREAIERAKKACAGPPK